MLRGRFQSRSPRRESMPEQTEMYEQRPVRTLTPIYQRDPTRNWDVSLKPQGPKLARDKLIEMMRDRKYHSAQEMEALLPHGEWVRAMREMIAEDYAFERVDNHFKLRMRSALEDRQVLVELIAGVDATKAETAPRVPTAVDVDGQEDTIDDVFGLSEEDGESEMPSGDAKEGVLVISDPASALTLDPLETVTMTAAILAKKNSGKTYLAMVIAEELMTNAQFPLVILDPMGTWYGLRATAEGVPSPHKILCLGGRFADIQITAKDGAKAADAVNAVRPLPVLIDMSLLSPTEQHEFVADFSMRLYVASPSDPIQVIIDEADEYAPQMARATNKQQQRSLEGIDRLVRRGRNKGIGVTMITQRCAVLSKNILSQVDSMWILNMVAPRDLLAVDEWLNNRVTDKQKADCLAQIPNLQRGLSYFLQGGVTPKFRKFKVRKKRTYDSSKTPGGGNKVLPGFSLLPADLLATARAIFALPTSGATDTGEE